jgi:hypothetical protein
MFLNLPMLLGISAIGVPILIHLLNKRKVERVVWAAMRFLRLSVEQNQRRIRLEDMILLILRCALVALFALVLARPVLRSSSAAGVFGGGDVTAVVILDNSYSMTQTDGVRSRFDAAREAAETVITSLPAGSSAAVLLASDVVAPVIPEPTFDLTYAAGQLKKAQVFDRPTDLLPAVREALNTLSGRTALRKEIYLVTDGQGAAFRRTAEIAKLLDDHKSDVRAHVLLVGQPVEANLGVSSLRVDGGLVAVNVPLRLEVSVRNYGRTDAQDVAVSIAVDDEPAMDQAVITTIPAGEERSVMLFARLKTAGHHAITARIAADHLPADDQRAVAVRGTDRVNVLLIDGDPGREPRDSEVFYLRAALRPVPRAEWDAYFIKPVTKSPTELESLRFEDFDAIVAANVTDFSPAVVNQLMAYVQSGGALLVFPGDNINLTFYNQILHDQSALLPTKLGPARGDAESQENHFALSDKHHDHPIASLWKDAAAGTLSAARFFRAFELIEGSGVKVQGPGPTANLDPETRTLNPVLRFSDGRLAMVESDFGKGRVILFASTADTAWNDLGARAGVFVPLIQRTLGHLVARQDEHLTIPVGQPFTHIAPFELAGKDALVTKAARPYDSDQTDLLRETRRVEVQYALPTLHFDATNFAGPYDVKLADAPPVRFATQPNAAESSLAAMTPDQERQLESAAHVIRWQPGASLKEDLASARVGTELWLPLAILALVLAATEMTLAHWFSKPK